MFIGLILAIVATGMPASPAAGEVQGSKADIVVAADGSGDFASIQAAIDSVAEGNRDRWVILVKDGVYEERFRIDRDRVTIRGESREGTRIEFPLLHSRFEQNPDDIGRGVININGDDVIIENLTVANTQPEIGPHAFTIFGRGTRTIVQDANVLSNGADTLALWNAETGMYYHANCHFQGAVDYVCPRGWCYITDSTFEQVGGSAGIWHAGDRDPDQKLVIRNSHFDGYEGFASAGIIVMRPFTCWM
jgi:pectinesterase